MQSLIRIMKNQIMKNNTIKFIDLFAGLGGIRLGFEQACHKLGYNSKCILTSEIKPFAIKTLKHNFSHDTFMGDIFNIKNEEIPDFDFLLAGFPCQPFSAGGKRQGFADTRGTLFFELERILRYKNPKGFILENVEGLVKHDLKNKSDSIGNTLKTILYTLENDLGYKVSWKVLDSIDFGVPQSRKRIFIVGLKDSNVDLSTYNKKNTFLKSIFEKDLECLNTPFTKKLLSKYSLSELYGKSIKDKRGGANNIHSWDLGIKGSCSEEQIELLNKLFKARRNKKWAIEIGIDWMDGMPLTCTQIKTFYNPNNLFGKCDLEEMLQDLVSKGYLRFEHPKKLVKENTENGIKSYREYDITKPKGYNIVTGKLSFDINKILDPENIAPTIVATDVCKIAVPDGNGLRKLSIREGLRLFGYPESYEIPLDINKGFDLLGNTVVVPVVKHVADKVLKAYMKDKDILK